MIVVNAAAGVAGHVDIRSGKLEPGLRMRIPATLFGDWAVHEGGRGGWAVSHAPTGLRVHTLGMEYSRAESLAIAALLAERMVGFAPDPETGEIPAEQHERWIPIIEAVYAEVTG